MCLIDIDRFSSLFDRDPFEQDFIFRRSIKQPVVFDRYDRCGTLLRSRLATYPSLFTKFSKVKLAPVE